MRAFLILIVLAVGVAIGGAVPRVSQVIQGALAGTGLMKTEPARDDPSASPNTEAKKPTDEKAEDHAAEGTIKMSAEQVASQEIRVSPVQGGDPLPAPDGPWHGHAGHRSDRTRAGAGRRYRGGDAQAPR